MLLLLVSIFALTKLHDLARLEPRLLPHRKLLRRGILKAAERVTPFLVESVIRVKTLGKTSQRTKTSPKRFVAIFLFGSFVEVSKI